MQYNFIGKTCPYCQFPIKQDSEVVHCRACKVPHHRECWVENGGCTTFGCRETTCQSVAADGLEISFEETSGRESAPARGGGVNKLLVSALVTTLLVLVVVVFAYINLLNNKSAVIPGDTANVLPQNYGPAVIAALDADYYIDYENGTIPIGDLAIGARVVDPSWEWEFRTGNGNIPQIGDQTKPVTWIVVAKGHYNGLGPHVTMLSDQLIGIFPFDNSTDRDSEFGSSHWGESGTTNATHGLRPWLNSSGIYEHEGFYRAFSDSFKQAVLKTTLPNKEWEYGIAYSTVDYVFAPSTTELGEVEHDWTYEIGTNYSYFRNGSDSGRVALLKGITYWYWTRSPNPSWLGSALRGISQDGGAFYSRDCAVNAANEIGVRPALNLKSEIMVSEIP